MDESRTLSGEISRRGFLRAGGVAAGAVLAGGLGTGLAACGGSPATGSRRRYRIAIVPKGLDNPVFSLAKLAAEQRARELGDVESIFTAASKTDTAGDIKILEGLIQEKVDAIGVSCNDATAYHDVINNAVDAGIKVMCWDSDAPSSKRSVFYGVDSAAVGQKMGQEMARLLAGKGNIVIVSGDAGALNLNERIAGVRRAVGSGIQILNVLYTNDDTVSAIQDTENAIRSYPNLDGIVMVGGWALFSDEGATPLLDQRKGKIKVVSFDPLQAVVQYLKDGIVQSVWTQDYWGWGYQSTTILYGLLHGQRWHETIPQPSTNVSPADWQTWQQRWKAVDQGTDAATRVWGEKAFTAPGPSGSSGPLRG
jgi:ribose transport system substrate-binding protein